MRPATVSDSAVTTRQRTSQVLVALVVAILLSVGVPMITGPLPESPALSESKESRLAHCDQLAGVAVDRLAAKGIDVLSDEWRRERQSAVQACMNDLAKFDWLKSSM